MVLIEVGPVVVLSTGETTTSWMLAVLADTTVTAVEGCNKRQAGSADVHPKGEGGAGRQRNDRSMGAASSGREDEEHGRDRSGKGSISIDPS